MSKYGTLIDGELVYAPRNIEYDDTLYIPATDDVYISAGYKLVVIPDKPDDGKEYMQTWTENETEITCVWVEIPDTRTPAEKRENAYETFKICDYMGTKHTVDEMNVLWQRYSAEGNTIIAEEISAIICDAKAQIREMFPDEE